MLGQQGTAISDSQSVSDRIVELVAINHAAACPAAIQQQALVLYRGWGTDIAIRADGSFVLVHEDSESEPLVNYEASPNWELMALVAGVERYPELAPLLPVRGASGPDCSGCKGQGRIPDTLVFCSECSGLGWLPDDGVQHSLAAGLRHSCRKRLPS